MTSLKEQADLDFMNLASQDAAQNMKIAIEQDVFGNVAAGASLTDVNNASNTPVNITASNVLGFILEAGQQLDENNIPEEGRFMIINPAVASVLKQSELRQAYLTGDSVSPLRNGFIGEVDRFRMYVSNNLSVSSGVASGLFGHPKAIAFASQMTNTESVRLESSFGDGVRGLSVYGYKVVVPTALGEFKLKTA